MSKIELKDITLDYTDQGNVYHALDGVTFSVEEGEFVSLIGSSGCGKSTTLSILAGLNNPQSGSFLIDGQETRGTGKDRGVVFQHYSLFPWMSVRKNIEFGIKQNFPKLSKKELTAKAMEYLEKVGLKGFENKYPYQLSGGMRQRVMIAIALVGSPSIVIADEPTTSLDVTIEAQILDVLKNLQKTLGTSIILITHDLGVIAKLCDRVLVMYGGKIVERGSVDEIFYDTAHPYTKGLMHSIAKLDTAKGHKLQPIEGTPPDLFAPPKGCPFAARCEYCMEICKDMPPQTYELSKEHETCCWLQHEYAPDTDMRRKVTEKGEV